MEALVLLVLKLVFYPVLAWGLLLSAALLYRYLRTSPNLKCASPCKARLITGVLFVIALWLMRNGVPDTITLNNVPSVVAFGCYLGALIIGSKDLLSRRAEFKAWFESKFGVDV